MGNSESQKIILPGPQKKVIEAAKTSKDHKKRPKGSISLDDGTDKDLLNLNKLDLSARVVDPADFIFPFENLVFESGRLKCIAFCGALEYLELIGCLSNIKRVAGTGYGAIVSLLVAVGFSWKQISEMLGNDIASVTKDGLFGGGGLLSGILRGLGVTSYGHDINEKFGRWLKEKCGDQDITFQQIFEKYKKELCIVVTNVNLMCVEYFHVKTTPNLPVRAAVQMSLTIPGAYIPKLEPVNGIDYLYVHGGVLCTYPVHCFDGWFLSMNPENRLIQKLFPLNDSVVDKKIKFKEFNDKTLGFSVYSNNEEDMMRSKLESRLGVLIPPRPSEETDLYKLRTENAKLKLEKEKSYITTCEAVDKFKRILDKNQFNDVELLDKKYLKEAFQDESVFTPEDVVSVFGKSVKLEVFFERLDHQGTGMVEYGELIQKVESHGMDVGNKLRAVNKKQTTSFISYMTILQSTISQNTRTDYIEDNDVHRTVGINTGHIETEDNDLHPMDKQFLIDRGYNSTRAFLQYYVAKNKCPKRSTTITQSIIEDTS
ncbi:hypothetical protein SNE40_007768 [Patella caerulea]|uniref:PNPLA domain-containing protein n=1 Tax=Patella caerulea TaxID=87958 RepID=A0AAN8PU65_PATCE